MTFLALFLRTSFTGGSRSDRLYYLGLVKPGADLKAWVREHLVLGQNKWEEQAILRRDRSLPPMTMRFEYDEASVFTLDLSKPGMFLEGFEDEGQSHLDPVLLKETDFAP